MYKERDRTGISSKSVGGESINFSAEIPPSVSRTIENYRNFYA